MSVLKELIAVGVRPARFGVIHRGVGVLEQRLGILTVVGVEADPDAGGDVELMALDAVRRGECGHDFLSRAGGIRAVHHLRKQEPRIRRRPGG